MREHYQNILRLINTIPIIISYRDRDGYIRACNQSFADLIGRPLSDIVDHHALEVLGQKRGAHFIKLDQECMASGKSLQTILPLIHADGSRRLYEIIRTPIKDPDREQARGVAIVAHDITEKEQLRGKAEDENYKYLASLEASPDPMVVYSMTGEVDYINPAFVKTFGWSLDESRGQKMNFVPDDCWPETYAMIEKVKRGESFRDIQTRRLTRDGRTIIVSITGAMYRNRQGQLQGSIITLRDITQQKHLEDQLNQSRKMEALGNLAGGIAHDFNNLLTAIRGHVSILRIRSELTPLAEEKFTKIEEIVDRGANLTKQLLGFAQGGKYLVEILNPNQVINDSIELFIRTLKEVTITTDLADDLWNIEADRGQIDQVLLNLYLNAWQAMQNNRTAATMAISTTNVTVTSQTHPGREPGRYIRIAISDNGCGMDEETRKHIFEPFFSTKRNLKGSGLGLSSAYGIISNHGGFIAVDSKPEHGSTFFIFLPAVDKPRHRTKPDQSQVLTGSATILLVEDEEMVREVNQEIISSLGYQVLTAENGSQALSLYQKRGEGIDLVVLDMIMPGMNGAEVYRRLKMIDPAVRVLLASGYSVELEAAKVMEQGCNGYIQKPFSIKELSHKIDEILKSTGKPE
ncbi:MAG: PAS domain S-box protein [Deltaproteobacteria bacterium]|nr:PAS domain S-box protein [Deltaproteobacteria bacterium]